MTSLTGPITDKVLHGMVDTCSISSFALFFDLVNKSVQLSLGDIIELQSVF